MFKINVRQLATDKFDWKIADLWRATDPDNKDNRVPYNTLLLYWHGIIKRFNKKDLIKICDALQCDLPDLINYEHK